MTDASLKNRITEDMKEAMRAKESARLAVIRFLLAAIKQVEVDAKTAVGEERTALTDEQTLAVINKLIKQRRDSKEQFEKAGRDDLAQQESYELSVLVHYLPPQLDEAEVESLVKAAISESSASGIQDMGKVMAILKPQLQGRADMGAVSAKIRSLLS
ncbi:MAG: GatB/YqeY domain-containing protein [Gammaproteobacteria bacterium]|nr:GatB/YqeY domain-containing protein [Gammaproteobacteria bacterium]